MRKDILIKLANHYSSLMNEALEKEKNKELRKKLSDYFLDMLDSSLKGQLSNPDDLLKIENNAKKNKDSFIAFFSEDYAEDLLPIVTKIHDTLNKFPTISLKTNIKDCSEPLFFNDKNYFELKLIFTEFKTEKTSCFNFNINIKNTHIHTNVLQQHINKFIESSFTYFQRELILKLEKKAKKPKPKIYQVPDVCKISNSEFNGNNQPLTSPRYEGKGAYELKPEKIQESGILNDSRFYTKIRSAILRMIKEYTKNRHTFSMEIKNNDIEITMDIKEFFQKADCPKREERKLLDYFMRGTNLLKLKTEAGSFIVEAIYKKALFKENNKKLKNLNNVKDTESIKQISFQLNKTIYLPILSNDKEDIYLTGGYAHITVNTEVILKSVLDCETCIKKITKKSNELREELELSNTRAQYKTYRKSTNDLAEYLNFKSEKIQTSKLLPINISLKEIAKKSYKTYIENDKIRKRKLLLYFVLMDLYIIQLAHKNFNLNIFEEIKNVSYSDNHIELLVITTSKMTKIIQEKRLSSQIVACK